MKNKTTRSWLQKGRPQRSQPPTWHRWSGGRGGKHRACKEAKLSVRSFGKEKGSRSFDRVMFSSWHSFGASSYPPGRGRREKHKPMRRLFCKIFRSYQDASWERQRPFPVAFIAFRARDFSKLLPVVLKVQLLSCKSLMHLHTFH